MMIKVKKVVGLALLLLFTTTVFNASTFVEAQTSTKEDINPQIILAKIKTSSSVEMKNITNADLILDKEGYSYQPLNSNSPLAIKKNVKITGKNVTFNDAELEGNLYICADNARINNVKIKGSLYINPGKDGAATINNVTAKNIYVLSGGLDGIYLNKVAAETLNIDSVSKVKLEVNYTTKINTTTVTTNAIISAAIETHGKLVISGKNKQKIAVELQGSFKQPVLVKSDAEITAAPSSSIEKISIEAEGSGAVVSLAGEFKNIDLNKSSKIEVSDKTKITGQVNGKPYGPKVDKPSQTGAESENSLEEMINEDTKIKETFDKLFLNKQPKEKELLDKFNGEKLRAQEKIFNGNNKNNGKISTSANIEVVNINDYNSLLVVVNKERSLPANWKPSDLVKVTVPYKGRNDAAYMRKEAADALAQLFAKAKKDKVYLYAVSGFRNYELQKTIYARNVAQLGETKAKMESAYPGKSEHQTGLAMDISSAAMGYTLKQSFGNTREGKWLAENAAAFGFIIRYPKGKESITGYIYEPWHIRYVGKEIATEIMKRGITLEEYFGLK
ncbi:M15 family metallopeptidase [Clostridium thermarum]|uniref:M15 family metallopeptidase n=1 Tax=Clostridium thermarum TaxID=1716543 RepID=UPI0013D0C639|nr:M15 family metallopeptidase [Clostridium thermarum]